MNKNYHKLYQLIQKLSKGEKKQVFQQIKSIGEKSIEYQKLFRAISKQQTPNEQELQEKFNSPSFSRLKKRLYDIVLNALVKNNLSLDLDLMLLYQLQQYHLLTNKGLHEQAQAKLLELREVARQNNRLNFIHYVDELIIYAISNINRYHTFDLDSFQELMQKMDTQALELTNLRSYRLLSAQLTFIQSKINSIQEQEKFYEVLKQHPLLLDENQALTPKAKLEFYRWHVIYFGYLKQFEQATLYIRKIFDHYEQFPPNAHEINEYCRHLINGAAISVGANQADLVDTLLNKIEQLLPQIKFNLLPLQISFVLLKVAWCSTVHQLEEALAVIETWKTWFYQLKNHTRSVAVAVTFADPLIRKKHYLEAIDFLEYAIHHPHNTGFLGKNAARLMLIICYYELEEFSLVESLTRTLWKKYQKSPTEFQGELLLLTFLKKIYSVLPADQATHFQQLKEQLVDLKTNAPEAITQLCYKFDYFLWIESHL